MIALLQHSSWLCLRYSRDVGRLDRPAPVAHACLIPSIQDSASISYRGRCNCSWKLTHEIDQCFAMFAEDECSARRLESSAGHIEGHGQHLTAETEVRHYPSSIRLTMTHIPHGWQHTEMLR